MTTAQAVREATARQARRRRRAIAYGQWQPPFVDAEPVRQHVLALRATGMSLASIVQHTRVNSGSLDHLIYGKRPYPPAVKIRTESAAAILAYWPTLDDYEDGAIIDATGTRRRMQALAAIGWPTTSVHQHVNHITAKAVERLRANERVTARTARAVRDLYNRVSEKPAEAFGVAPWVAERTRGYARKFRWANPPAWDDDTIDDPKAHPEWTGYCGTDQGWWIHTIQKIAMCDNCETAHQQWKADRQGMPRSEYMAALGKARANASNRGVSIAHDGRELIRLGCELDEAASRLGVTRHHLQQLMGRHPEMEAA
ncbi:hypothetical protein [Streptomyces sp. NPDC086838]|uniref:hypothetical protein n=1 Tax=Streptomyces sp. NPDC086838 TaxID=3365762 RepID=UPI0037F59B75